MFNPVRAPVQHWWCTARSVTAFAITDFIYSDDSFDRLSSIRYTTYLPTSHVISDNHVNENSYQQCEILCKMFGRKVSNAFLNRQFILQFC
ncbi:hypothetical protein EWJ80_18730 [Salmonella enterica subsp. enterica serovar Java]|uniref:Uncharacterized protein n=2 Tax=Salmonella enterica I TaxID=59201 RepID=A0A426WLL7_SALEB|nr:hypothetical protein [Salmonella enterica subsp. enterica]EAB4596579.1 hypothetical protein [Salmonella enterica]EBS1365012.1 hypothetical protein [Salmonella enterica subsp. enterica serovar Virchow]EBS1834701.1 hypothetical protein [Salmonella enterica subsp. enterica serovar Java]EBZ0799661.1 hypothetical protein [Salmonella enterica subsp. enterica serovar Abony]ECD0110942.1 hypothetical protein [Salmonella enterica subsp. enterica serovar Paratyphi B]